VSVKFTVSVVVGPIVDGASSFTPGNITGSAMSVEPEGELLQLDSEAPRRARANIPDNADFIAASNGCALQPYGSRRHTL
jgi:hypothetical protein